MCRTPAAPTLYQKYGCGPFHQIINHCGAIRSANLSFGRSERKPNLTFAKREICPQLGSLLRANHFPGFDPLIELIIGD